MTAQIATGHRTETLPYARLATPDHHYLEGEPIRVLFHPPDATEYEAVVADTKEQSVTEELLAINSLDLAEGLPAGKYNVRVRHRVAPSWWSPWSIARPIEVHPCAEADRVEALRVEAHRLSLLVQTDVHGIVTLTDPWGFPPAARSGGEEPGWFRTPVYEGATTLVNELPDYYRDPFKYFLDAVAMLRESGFAFRTWHDMVTGAVEPGARSVILQFDMDGGPRSMSRILDPLLEMGVSASVMIHRECFDWYSYRIEDLDPSMLQRAESRGWAIGYHNNAVGNVQRMERAGDYGELVMREAARRFADDVEVLRRHFDVRCYTNHGGNVLNHRLVAPLKTDITWVDRGNTAIWKSIRAMFSDGGFLARPQPLHEWVRRLSARGGGAYFFRFHPNKYGNYRPPWDVPPIDPDEAGQRGGCAGAVSAELRRWVEEECRKQQRWFEHRRSWRLGELFSYEGESGIKASRHQGIEPTADSRRPISRHFTAERDIEALVDRFRQRRKPVFLREYPAPEGDPRVFWWKLLRHFGPTSGEVLNVGALPPESRDETTDFLNAAVTVVEMDIDPARQPDILGDIAQLPPALHNRFSAALLFGLPYVHSPGRAVESCRTALIDGGVGLFGFPDDMHPRRGAAWDPKNRPVWRHGREPLRDIGLRGRLWSFDRACLEDLFRQWSHVTVENHSNYWFAVCRP